MTDRLTKSNPQNQAHFIWLSSWVAILPDRNTAGAASAIGHLVGDGKRVKAAPEKKKLYVMKEISS
jgi:hypothetical protein